MTGCTERLFVSYGNVGDLIVTTLLGLRYHASAHDIILFLFRQEEFSKYWTEQSTRLLLNEQGNDINTNVSPFGAKDFVCFLKPTSL